MNKFRFILVTVFCIGILQAQSTFDYSQPSSTWGANCGNPQAMRQSPINIETGETVIEYERIHFGYQWDVLLDGTFSNNGFGVRLVADGEAVSFRNEFGDYFVSHVDFHWGPRDDAGTGHQINGKSFGLELHFVTIRQGANLSNLTNIGPDTKFGSIAVISVLAEAIDMPISGVWAKLDPEMVTYEDDFINVTDFSWSMLLSSTSSMAGYYRYPGSQTSPGCWEVVHWFVLQDTISVPSEYLAQLRTTRFDDGELITLNHRSPQPLNYRIVYRGGGVQVRVVLKPMLIMSVLFLLFLIC